MENSKSTLKAFSKKYDTHRAADIRLVEAVIDKLKITKTMNILDFGCGTGNYLEVGQTHEILFSIAKTSFLPHSKKTKQPQ